LSFVTNSKTKQNKIISAAVQQVMMAPTAQQNKIIFQQKLYKLLKGKAKQY
jgi:hypothetical protein